MSSPFNINPNRRARRNGPSTLPWDPARDLEGLAALNVSAGPSKRQKSRSPFAHRSETSSQSIGKRKRAAILLSSVTPLEDSPTERGRRVKPKPKTQSRFSSENGVPAPAEPLRTSQTVVKREQSRPHEPIHASAKKHASSELGVLERGVMSGAELPRKDQVENGNFATIDHLRKEIEALKKQIHEGKKTAKKQSKVIDELRQELNSGIKSLKDKNNEIQALKSKSKKTDEVLSSIETSMQCQVCMDLFSRPYACSPCGHVLCLPCLQSWFNQAPPSDDDPDPSDPEYKVYRRKSCPCCRATVVGRPAPMFVVKAIAASLAKTKNSQSPQQPQQPASESDPWEGLFPPVDEEGYELASSYDEGDGYDSDEGDYDHSDDGDEGYDDDDDEQFGEVDDNRRFEYGTDSDEEPYDGEYVRPLWEPPSITCVDQEVAPYPLALDDLRLLRRGATIEMIEMFAMDYSHDTGIVATVNRFNQLFLGWNIMLSSDDPTGERFINWCLDDMVYNPHRWSVADNRAAGRGWDAWKLLPSSEMDDYSTTDTEVWMADGPDSDMDLH